MSEFKDNIQKLHSHHNFKITNSYGCRDYYKYYKKHQKSDLPEKLFRLILEDIFEQLYAKYLSKYLRVKLPSKMGDIFIKKFEFKVYQRKDGSYTKRTPVDWPKTVDLWENDPEAYKDKVVVKHELPYYHHLFYKTYRQDFKNHQVFQLKTCRKLNKKIHQQMTLHKFF